MPTLTTELASRAYPGRVCVIARMPDADIRFVYALTGRSEASRSRSLAVDATQVTVVDTRASGAHDDLRHYVAALNGGAWVVVGNGDHVEPLAGALRLSDAATETQVEAAWRPHTFEPDPPIYTPRIWVGASAAGAADEALWAGAVVRADDGTPVHRLWRLDGLRPGQAALLTTYAGDLDEPTPSGQLVHVTTDADAGDALIDEVWDALDRRLRIAALMLAPARGDLRSATLRS